MVEGGVQADRVIALIQESKTVDETLYRTLHGNKALPNIVYDIEQIKILYAISTPQRKQTLETVYRIDKLALISTSSINAKLLELLTQTNIKYEINNKEAKKNFNPLAPKPATTQ